MTNEETIFAEALGKGSAPERGAYLDEACAGNAQLRSAVDALLLAHQKARGILEAPALGLDVTSEIRPCSEGVGSTVGPYKLLQQIGEGGMAVVFLAEQNRPIQRKVALKIIKPGMDSRQVIARFEAERQALALMDHPNIAKVLEAGTTAPASGFPGQPYFVMELVKGVPITRYCDEHHLMPRDRLELFVQVCSAVQHAHQKGIIHRDLKPSNVLVALYDGKPVPKVIDFGIAKATGQPLTARTLFTSFGSVVGTPEYMSPEQAELNQLDVDTRSDVYSLGVLLYELLTGSTPLEHNRFKAAALLEMLRVVREEEPPKPSTRLSTTQGLPSIAANRGLEPKKLSALVHGELDWIVMKSLEKDRNRRYETANGFAMDVQRYLDDEAVQACPPSAGYKLRKFARKHRMALRVAVAFLLLLIAATVFSSWQAVRATRAEHTAAAEAQKARTEAASALAVNDFLNRDLLGQTYPYLPYDTYTQPLGELKLVTVLERASAKLEGRFPDQPLVEAALHQTIGLTYFELDYGSGTQHRAQVHFQRAVELRRAHLGEEHPDTLTSMQYLGSVKGDLDLISRVLEIRRRVFGKDHPDTMTCMCVLGLAAREKGEKARAIELFRETLEARRRVFGEDHPSTAWTMTCLAGTLVESTGAAGIPAADDREIESLFRHALTVLRKTRGASLNMYQCAQGFAHFFHVRHRYEEAEAVFQDALLRLDALPAAAPEMKAAMTSELNDVYRSWGKPERAAEWERKRAAAATTRPLKE